MSSRTERLMPNGVPRYVRCYDNGGETIDRYTVVFTKKPLNVFQQGNFRYFLSVCMSGMPYHPQGVCQHSEDPFLIDRPTYGHLGKRIAFGDLPEDCQKVVRSNYKYVWDIDVEEE